jgi:hypothetical protein
MGWFDDQRQAQFLGCRNTIVFAAQHGMTRRWNPQAVPHLLGAQLVHRQRRRQDAAAGVGNAGALEQALHAAVFTATAMQNDEGAVDFFGQQAGEEVIAHVDTECIHTGTLQGFKHGIAGLERHFALGALAAEQHRDATEVGRRDRGEQGGVISDHFDAPFSAVNKGLASSLGARPPISPAPWHSRMSPARSSGLTIGARSTPRSM